MTDPSTPEPGDGQIDIGYADAMAEIDEILDQLSDDAIDIDVLSTRVSRAAQLIALCRARITSAQEQVSEIVDAIASPRPDE